MERTPDRIRDEWLVLKAQGGDGDALTELVGRWQPRLLRHAARLTGEADAARDIVQEAWLAMVKRLRTLDDPACFPRWAYQIVTRRSADWVKGRVRERRRAEQLAPRAATPEEEVAGTDEEIDDLRVAVRRLPADRRTLLSMHYLDGLSVAEIAEALGIPAGTVKSRLFHARSELRELLEKERIKP